MSDDSSKLRALGDASQIWQGAAIAAGLGALLGAFGVGRSEKARRLQRERQNFEAARSLAIRAAIGTGVVTKELRDALTAEGITFIPQHRRWPY